MDLAKKCNPAGQARDLVADLAICEAATPGPYRTWKCECGHRVCNQMFISVTNSGGRLNPEDAKFYSEAREGWPHAIRLAIQAKAAIRAFHGEVVSESLRADTAEAEVDRLRNELNILQEQLQCSGRCRD